MPQFLPFAATGSAGDPNFPDNTGGGGGLLEIQEFFLVSAETSQDHSTGQTTLNVDYAGDFPTSGSGFLRGPATNVSNKSNPETQAVSWTGRTDVSLTGLSGPAVALGWDQNAQIYDRPNNNFQDFTWTAPQDCNLVRILAAGPGGGGGGGELNGGGGNAQGGSGGAGGVYGWQSIVVTPNVTYHIRIGAGANSNTSGQNTLFATNSTFINSLLTWHGGEAGAAGAGGSIARGGRGFGEFIPFAISGTTGNGNTQSTSIDNALIGLNYPHNGTASGSAGGGGAGGNSREYGANGASGLVSGHAGGGPGGGGGGWQKGIFGAPSIAGGRRDTGIGGIGGDGGMVLYAYVGQS